MTNSVASEKATKTATPATAITSTVAAPIREAARVEKCSRRGLGLIGEQFGMRWISVLPLGALLNEVLAYLFQLHAR